MSPASSLSCGTRAVVFVTQIHRHRSPCLIFSELFLDNGTSFRVLVSISCALLPHLLRFSLRFTLRVSSVVPSPVRLLLRLAQARAVTINSFASPKSSLRHLKSVVFLGDVQPGSDYEYYTHQSGRAPPVRSLIQFKDALKLLGNFRSLRKILGPTIVNLFSAGDALQL